MNCPAAKKLLHEYADNTLGTADTARVDAHLKNCKDCSRELASIRALKKRLAALPMHAPTRGFEGRVRERLAANQKTHASKVLHFTKAKRFVLPVGAAASVVIGVLAVTLNHYTTQQMRSTPVLSERAEYKNDLHGVATQQDTQTRAKKRVVISESLKDSFSTHARRDEAIPSAAEKRAVDDELQFTMEESVAKERSAPAPETMKAKNDAGKGAGAPSSFAADSEAKPQQLADIDIPVYGFSLAVNANAGDSAARSMKKSSAKSESPRTHGALAHQNALRVVDAVKRAGGNVISLTDDAAQGQSVVLAELPVEKYNAFAAALKDLGVVRSPQSAPSADMKSVTVKVRVAEE